VPFRDPAHDTVDRQAGRRLDAVVGGGPRLGEAPVVVRAQTPLLSRAMVAQLCSYTRYGSRWPRRGGGGILPLPSPRRRGRSR